MAGECGASVIEYAVILSLLSIAAIVLIYGIGDEIRAAFQGALDQMRQYTGS